ncbi:MAG: KEOPS complex subunit Pcc1 [Methermicoccaceae archaeon]
MESLRCIIDVPMNSLMLDTIYSALLVETKSVQALKGKIELKKDEKSLVMIFLANDVSTLRASLNTWLRLLTTSMEMWIECNNTTFPNNSHGSGL